jgi:hypothetical protein
MNNAQSYTNTPAPLHLQPSGFTIYVKRLGFVDILAVCERLVISQYVEDQKPYLAQLDNSEDRIAYLRQAQADQPKGAYLHQLALEKIVQKDGIAAILDFGLKECNPDIDIDNFTNKTTADERGQVFEIFCADIAEMGNEVLEDKKEDGKKPRKKRATKKKTGGRS